MNDFTEINVEKKQERAYDILCDNIDEYLDALPDEAKNVDTDLIANGVYNYSTEMKYLTTVYGFQQRDEGLRDGYNNGYRSGAKDGSRRGFACGCLFMVGAAMLFGATINLLNRFDVWTRLGTLKIRKERRK